MQRTHQEFSLGYTATIDPTPGTYMGDAYDASLANIRYNHLAACPVARGGPELRITDERVPTTGVQPVTIAVIDGLPVNLADANTAKSVVDKLIADRDSAVVDLKGARETIAARDAEVSRLTDELAAAAVTPAQLADAAAAYGRTIADAKRLGVTVTDGMSADDARKAAVTAKIGDRSAHYDAAQIAVAFDTLVAGLGDAAPTTGDPLASVIGDTANVTDARTKFDQARAARFDRFNSAHRGAASQGA